MIGLCTVGMLVSGCSKSPTPTPVASPKPQPDSVVLQGTWRGQEAGATTKGSPSLAISGTTLEFHGANPQEWYKGTFTLREDTLPKQLEAVVTECPFPGYVGKTSHAIYKLEDGKLTLAGNEPGNPAVPANFDAPGSRQLVFTLQH